MKYTLLKDGLINALENEEDGGVLSSSPLLLLLPETKSPKSETDNSDFKLELETNEELFKSKSSKFDVCKSETPELIEVLCDLSVKEEMVEAREEKEGMLREREGAEKEEEEFVFWKGGGIVAGPGEGGGASRIAHSNAVTYNIIIK